MALQAARPAAVALLLAAMLLAAWLAGGGDTAGVGAQNDKLRTIIEVDGGLSSEMVFEVNLPNQGSYLNDDDQIEITLRPEFSLPGSVAAGKIRLSGSTDGSTAPIPTTEQTTISGKKLTLTIPASVENRVTTGEHLVITIAANSGIVAPETPIGFDNPDDGYPVVIKFLGGNGEDDVDSPDENIIVVRNPVSSTVPGAAIRVELETYTKEQIGSNQEIEVDFSGPSEDASFGLPTSIAKTRVTFRTTEVDDENKVKAVSFSPSDVLVQGDRVTLTIPEEKVIRAGNFTISFSQFAGIKNPFAAGKREIKVRAFVPHYVEDIIEAIILRTTTVKPLEGPRGTQFTLEGKGYAQGTVTIFEADSKEIKEEIDEEEDRKAPVIDPGETLASVKTSKGSFRVKIVAGGEPGVPKYKVWTRDSNGAIDAAVFDITSSMSFAPAEVGTGDRLNVTIRDWEVGDGPGVAAVQIGGELVAPFVKERQEYTNCFAYQGLRTPDENGTISLRIEVPPNVPPGDQAVAVYGPRQLEPILTAEEKACTELDDSEDRGSAQGTPESVSLVAQPNPLVIETVEIVAESLTLSPSAAVRGQRIAISGTGFTRATDGSDDIRSVSIKQLPSARRCIPVRGEHHGGLCVQGYGAAGCAHRGQRGAGGRLGSHAGAGDAGGAGGGHRPGPGAG